MKTKQQFIDEVMGSIEGIAGAEANPFLYEKISFQLKNRAKKEYTGWKVWTQAACLALIVAGNIIACIHFTHTEKKSRQNTNPLKEEYFSSPNDYTYE